MRTKDMTAIERTMKNLKRNGIDAYYVETKDEVKDLAKSLISEGDVITHGGSVTLKECDLIALFDSGDYQYIDRSKAKDRDELEEIYRKAYSADAYFSSANAVTQGGAIYNVDGNSNRVSAILYGPKSVIFVVGFNKIVKDLDEAVYRVKSVSAPMNTKRLDCDTYCRNAGECLSVGRDASYMCDGCRTEGRICCNYVICAKQREPGRMKVIIVGEKLGY